MNSFVQTYGGDELDASVLLIPLLGFLPPEDPRVIGTLDAIERDLTHDGLVKRYHTTEVEDGLPPGEGTFLACSFWLVDNLALQGRHRRSVRDVRAAARVSPTTSACWPRNTTRSRNVRSVTSRRRFRTLRWCIPA